MTRKKRDNTTIELTPGDHPVGSGIQRYCWLPATRALAEYIGGTVNE